MLRIQSNVSKNQTHDQRMQGTLQLFHTQAQLDASGKDVKALAADGVPGAGRRHIALRVAACTGTGCHHRPARKATNDCFRQWNGDDEHGRSQVVPKHARRMALHRTRQTDAKRLRGKFQWQRPRRMPQRNPVLIAGTSADRHHRMEGGLQPKSTTFLSGQYHAQ